MSQRERNVTSLLAALLAYLITATGRRLFGLDPL